MSIGTAIKHFQNNFIDFIKNNNVHDVVRLECNNYQLTLKKNYDNVKIEICYYDRKRKFFMPNMMYLYVDNKDIDITKENCFYDIVKNELNNIIERYQTMLEEM